jgi:hypothetical protein
MKRRKYIDPHQLFEELRVDYLSFIEELKNNDIATPLVYGDKIPIDLADKLRDKYPKYITRPRPVKIIKKAAPSPSEESIALALFGNKIRVVSLSPDGTYQFVDGTRKLHNILYVTSSETLALQIAVDELEYLINDSKSKEKDFQNFFEKHPDFIKTDEYRQVHSQVILTKNEHETYIPDFVLEPVSQKLLCDILELKLPSAKIFSLSKRRMRFSSAVFEVIAQLREYSMFFDEEVNRQKIYEKYGFSAFKPKMFVIIGRRGDLSPIDVRKMEADIPNIILRTYDDIAEKAKARIDVMKKGIYKIKR